MKIEKLKISKSVSQTLGIKEINLERLGSVVALIGRNGSGKSRILKLIEGKFIAYVNINNILNDSITGLPKAIFDRVQNYLSHSIYKEISTSYLKKIEAERDFQHDSTNQTLRDLVSKTNSEYAQHQNNSPQYRQEFQNTTQIVDNLNLSIQQIARKYFRKINYSEIHQLQAAIETGARVQGDNSVTFETLIESVTEQNNYNELQTIYGSALTYLSKLPHQLVYDYNEARDNENQNFEDSVSFKRFQSLKKFVQDFLNKDLKWEREKVSQDLSINGLTATIRGIWKLDNRLFNYNDLSDGEKTLFAYSLLFFLLDQNPKIHIKESIIIIDEPELHLHPESQILLIRGIRRVIEEKGQLWIATHSINILSDLIPEEIFMVKDSEIISPGRMTPIKSFNELMGIDNHIERLHNFIGDISIWEYVNFMTQCSNNPDTISDASPKDPEIEVLKKSLKDHKSGSILLDFGAGRGRVYKGLVGDKLLGSNILYSALEPNPDNIEELKKLSLNGIYQTYESLPDSTFDYILLCNVLHEIPIKEWALTLNKLKSHLMIMAIY